MAYYSAPFNLVVDTSGSGYVTSSAITFVYNSASYFNPITSGSLASIKTKTTNATIDGAKGELFIELSNADLQSSKEVIRFALSGSTNDPKVGIGFDLNETLLTPFDIRTKQDSPDGTELFLRTTRTDRGAAVGDYVGSIFFLVESGSFNTGSKQDFIQSGSVASIRTQVTNINELGAEGVLKINTARASTEATRALWTMGYNANPIITGNFGSITSGSLSIAYNNSTATNNKDVLSIIEQISNGYAGLYYVSESIATDSLTTVADLKNDINVGAIVDYTLYKGSTYARTGQLMVTFDRSDTTVSYTDTSNRHLGTPPGAGDPTFSVDATSGYLQITYGGGLDFRAFIKRF